MKMGNIKISAVPMWNFGMKNKKLYQPYKPKNKIKEEQENWYVI